MWPRERIKPYANNPKVHTKPAIEKLARAFQRFGFRGSLWVDKKGVLIKGHRSLLALEFLGVATVPVEICDDLNPAEVKALRLEDNRASEDSNNNDQLIGSELADLKAGGFDLELTGFSEREISGYLDTQEDTSPQLGALEYRIVVDCASEADQGKLLRQFEKEGLTCRALMS